MKPRLGCITIPAIIAVVLSILMVGGITLARGGILYSPGGLNAQETGKVIGGVRSHAGLADQCGSCHPAPWDAEAMVDKCIACHVDVGWDPENFHRTIMEGITGCRGCHTDHNGPTGALTDIDLKRFPHAALGYSLSAHQETTGGSAFICEDCHEQKLSIFEESTCTDCHSQIDFGFTEMHVAAFGQGCLACHDGVDAYGKGKFDHNQAAFALVGEHVEADCADCHADNTTPQALKATPQNCYACHQEDDPHLGRMGQDCASCHTPADWVQSSFDHAALTFPLLGKHAQVACLACHLDANLKATPQECFTCHGEQDPHQGNLGDDCASCHTPENWKQVHFDHATALFPLVGEHLTVTCQQCHLTKIFKETPQECSACHGDQDPHAGELGTVCDTCHTPVDWHEISFDHNTAEFPLVGKHSSVGCKDCHTDNLFKDTPQGCFACHGDADPHQGQLGQDCATCHTPESWDDVNFDHATSDFNLTGAHTSVGCKDCHEDSLFKSTPTSCYSCHAEDDQHNGQLGTDCATCHSTSAWGNVTFDHSKSSFPLTGQHIGVSCSSCHVNGNYKGTPKNCYACHAADDAHGGQYGTDCKACHNPNNWEAHFDHSGFPLNGAHAGLPCTDCHPGGNFKGTSPACSACHDEPAYHAGMFSSGCGDCHSTNAWRPAQYNGAHTFPKRHGEGGNTCRTCHPSRLSQYTCYECHNQNEIRNKHVEEGIPNFDNCMQCHPDGQKHEDKLSVSQRYVRLFTWIHKTWGGSW